MKLVTVDISDKNHLISLEELGNDESEKWNKVHGILDVYAHCLTEEEIEKTSLGGENPFVEHNLAHEPKFVDFLKRAILLNGNEEIIIEAGLEGISNQRILQYLDRLDYKEKLLFLNFIRNDNSTSDFFKTSDFDVVQLFLKLATRELTFPIFHFTKYKMSLCGNFDLSFPIFFENTEIKELYIKLAEEVGLYIR